VQIDVFEQPILIRFNTIMRFDAGREMGGKESSEVAPEVLLSRQPASIPNQVRPNILNKLKRFRSFPFFAYTYGTDQALWTEKRLMKTRIEIFG